MTHPQTIARLLLLALAGLLWGLLLLSQESGDYVIRIGHVEENLYLA